MKRKIIAIAFFASLLVASLFYLVVVPLRRGFLGPISISAPQCNTNAFGQVTATVTITNGGSHTIRFAIGTQVLRSSNWVDAASGESNHYNLFVDPNPLIAPQSERVVAVGIPATTSPWRIYALCQKEYPQHWSTRLRWVSDVYLLKRGVVEHFYGRQIGDDGAHPVAER